MRAFAWFCLAAAAAARVDGAEPQATFLDNCSACHQASGQGIPGVFPALAGNSFVKGDAAQVVGVILGGRGGMPSFRNDLSDEQIAAAASYIRGSWGNRAKPVSAAFIAETRIKTNNPRSQNPTMHN
jgi:cytochrome c6